MWKVGHRRLQLLAVGRDIEPTSEGHAVPQVDEVLLGIDRLAEVVAEGPVEDVDVAGIDQVRQVADLRGGQGRTVGSLLQASLVGGQEGPRLAQAQAAVGGALPGGTEVPHRQPDIERPQVDLRPIEVDQPGDLLALELQVAGVVVRVDDDLGQEAGGRLVQHGERLGDALAHQVEVLRQVGIEDRSLRFRAGVRPQGVDHVEQVDDLRLGTPPGRRERAHRAVELGQQRPGVAQLARRAARPDPGIAVLAGQEIEDGVEGALGVTLVLGAMQEGRALPGRMDPGHRTGAVASDVADERVLEENLLATHAVLVAAQEELRRSPSFSVSMKNDVLTVPR